MVAISTLLGPAAILTLALANPIASPNAPIDKRQWWYYQNPNTAGLVCADGVSNPACRDINKVWKREAGAPVVDKRQWWYYQNPNTAGLVCADGVSNPACRDINKVWKRNEHKDLGSTEQILMHVKELLEAGGAAPYTLYAFDLINGETGKTAHIPEVKGTEDEVLAAVKKALEAAS